MTIDTAKELTAMASHNPKKLSHLVDLCKGFIENIALKKGEGGCVAVGVAGLRLDVLNILATRNDSYNHNHLHILHISVNLLLKIP